MDPDTKLSTLLDLAESLGMEVRRMPPMGGTDHPGGALVRLRGKEILFVDPSASTGDCIDAVARALAGRPELADRFLPPDIRDAIDATAEGE